MRNPCFAGPPFAKSAAVTVHANSSHFKASQMLFELSVRGREEVARAQSIGCLRTISPEWEHGRPSGWEHGIGIFFVRPDGTTDLYAPAIRGGSFAFGWRLYG